MTGKLTPEQIGQRARSAVDKVDASGVRGMTLLSLQEIEALVIVAALSGMLAPKQNVTETTKQQG